MPGTTRLRWTRSVRLVPAGREPVETGLARVRSEDLLDRSFTATDDFDPRTGLAGEADVPPHRAFNFGPDEQGARTVEWIVERLCRAWQPAGDWYVDAAAGPHEAHLLKLDSSRARGVLGWAPVWTLERTLQHIVAWQRAWQEGGDMRAFTLAQIDRYLEDARGGGPDSTPERATP